MANTDFELVEFTASAIVVRYIPDGCEFIFDIVANGTGSFKLGDRPEVGEVVPAQPAAVAVYDEARAFAAAEAKALGLLRGTP